MGDTMYTYQFEYDHEDNTFRVRRYPDNRTTVWMDDTYLTEGAQNTPEELWADYAYINGVDK